MCLLLFVLDVFKMFLTECTHVFNNSIDLTLKKDIYRYCPYPLIKKIFMRNISRYITKVDRHFVSIGYYIN